ncbi:MAG TPA: DUF4199 domain-containing protein [Mucilaginibacter sp.]
METTTPVQNATKLATKWAFVYLITAVIITYAFQFLNVDTNSPLKYISYIPFIGYLFLAQKEYRDQIGGYISFGDAFSAGFRYSIFVGLLMAIFSYLYLTILSPEVWQKAMDATQTALEDKGISGSQAEKTMSMMKQWGPLFGAFGAAIVYAIFGAVISLIGAAIFKKELSPFDIAQNAIDPTETEV